MKKLITILIIVFSLNSSNAQQITFNTSIFNYEEVPPLVQYLKIVGVCNFVLWSDEIKADFNFFSPTVSKFNNPIPGFGFRKNLNLVALELNMFPYTNPSLKNTKWNYQFVWVWNKFTFVKNENWKLDFGFSANSDFGLGLVLGVKAKYSERLSLHSRINLLKSTYFDELENIDYKYAPSIQVGINYNFKRKSN